MRIIIYQNIEQIENFRIKVIIKLLKDYEKKINTYIILAIFLKQSIEVKNKWNIYDVGSLSFFQTTCLTELPDVAPCNGTVRLPPPCEDSPSSGSSKDRRDESPRRRCRLLAPVLFLVAVLLLGGLCLPFLLQSAPATHQQRLDVIRRILTEVPLIDGWAFVIRHMIYHRKFAHALIANKFRFM